MTPNGSPVTDPLTLATEALERADKAGDELGRVCAEGPHRAFRMSVPARPDKDSDLIIGASLADVPALANALKEAATIAERARDPRFTDFDTYITFEMYDEATEQGARLGVELNEARVALKEALEREKALLLINETYANRESVSGERIASLEAERDKWRGIAHHLAEEACFSDDGECPHYKAALTDRQEP